MIDADVPRSLRESIDKHLAHDESILRLEQPVPDRFKADLGGLGFAIGVPFTLFSLFAAIEAARGKALWNGQAGHIVGPVLVASLFLALSCLMLANPVFMRRAARNVAYVITNRRVLIVRRGLLGIEAESFPADRLRLRLRPDVSGSGGDIEMVAGMEFDAEDGDREELFRMYALRDVRATEAVLRNLIQSSSKSSL